MKEVPQWGDSRTASEVQTQKLVVKMHEDPWSIKGLPSHLLLRRWSFPLWHLPDILPLWPELIPQDYNFHGCIPLCNEESHINFPECSTTPWKARARRSRSQSRQYWTRIRSSLYSSRNTDNHDNRARLSLKDKAATMVQKVCRSYRVRRRLADSAVTRKLWKADKVLLDFECILCCFCAYFVAFVYASLNRFSWILEGGMLWIMHFWITAPFPSSRTRSKRCF